MTTHNQNPDAPESDRSDGDADRSPDRPEAEITDRAIGHLPIVALTEAEIAACEAEIPRWSVEIGSRFVLRSVRDGSPFTVIALDPTFEATGIVVVAGSPVELVERVRALATLLDLGSRAIAAPVVPVPVPVPAAPVRRAPAPIAPASTEPGAPKLTPDVLERARMSGFLGDPCPTCGAMTLVRTGSCATCASCHNTSGCS